MNKEQLDQLGKALRAQFPLIGMIRRRAAARQLCALRNEPQVIPLLAGALTSNDRVVAGLVRTALCALDGSARDALCALAIREPGGAAGTLCLEKGYRPSDPEQDALFLFVTRQLDLYFKEAEYGGDEFQTLRLAYDRADEKIRARVMDVVRKGDRRCQPFAVRPRKALEECSDHEIQLALASCLKHKDRSRLFVLCLALPLKFSFPLLEKFRASGWEPEPPELKSLYRQLLADSRSAEMPVSKPPDAASSLFDSLLAQGRGPAWTAKSEGDLRAVIEGEDPLEGVSAVAALAGKPKLSPEVVTAVKNSAHWLVRLAGLAAGIGKDILADSAKDANYWVRELAGSAGVLEFWPATATPADLDRLNRAPPEAFAGQMGAVRKVLRGILAHRVTDIGGVEPVMIEAGETDVEIIVQ